MNFESLVNHISAIQDTLQAQAAHSVNLALTSGNEIRHSLTAELQTSDIQRNDWQIPANKIFNKIPYTHLKYISKKSNDLSQKRLCKNSINEARI